MLLHSYTYSTCSFSFPICFTHQPPPLRPTSRRLSPNLLHPYSVQRHFLLDDHGNNKVYRQQSCSSIIVYTSTTNESLLVHFIPHTLYPRFICYPFPYLNLIFLSHSPPHYDSFTLCSLQLPSTLVSLYDNEPSDNQYKHSPDTTHSYTLKTFRDVSYGGDEITYNEQSDEESCERKKTERGGVYVMNDVYGTEEWNE